MNPYTLFVLVAVIGGIWVLRQAGRMSPKQARKFGAKVMGWCLLLVGVLFSLHGNLAIGLPVLGVGAGMLGFSNFSMPSWSGGPKSASQAPAPPRTNMDRSEAYDVLGLKPGASSDDINAAYKRLQRVNHPDTGGSTYLAAKINQARDLLLGN